MVLSYIYQDTAGIKGLTLIHLFRRVASRGHSGGSEPGCDERVDTVSTSYGSAEFLSAAHDNGDSTKADVLKTALGLPSYRGHCASRCV